MPRAGSLGSLGNTYKSGKGAMGIQRELRNQTNRNYEINDVKLVGDKFVFRIAGKKFMTVTASSGMKRKIASKLCTPVETDPMRPQL